MKHQARLGSKKILSDPRKLGEGRVEEAINREGEPEFGKGFSSLCVHVYARNQGRSYCSEPIWRHHLQALWCPPDLSCLVTPCK